MLSALLKCLLQQLHWEPASTLLLPGSAVPSSAAVCRCTLGLLEDKAASGSPIIGRGESREVALLLETPATEWASDCHAFVVLLGAGESCLRHPQMATSRNSIFG